MTTVWKIWKHRNKIVFNKGKVDVVDIFVLTQLKAWSRVKIGRQRLHCSF